jgi:hypothetical protein
MARKGGQWLLRPVRALPELRLLMLLLGVLLLLLLLLLLLGGD